MPADGHLHDPGDYYLRISSHLAGRVEIRAALRSVKAEIEHILPLDHLDVCLVDDEGLWNTSYEVGLRTRWSLSRTLMALSPVRDILTGKTEWMLTDNAMVDARYVFPGSVSQPIFKYGLKSRVNVAMKVLGRTIGSLNCSSRQEAIYTEDTVARVRHVADVLAPYFFALRSGEKAKHAAIVRAEAQAREEGLRQGALQLTQALEQERQRIGMDLHDQTLADLTRIMRDLSAQAGGDAARAGIVSRLQDCIQDLRRIIDTAVPTLLELFGFAHAVRIHLERAVGDQGGVAILVLDDTAAAPDRLDQTTRTALFRIVQEAINNAARHSGADRIEVRITLDAGALRLTVADNGRGLAAGGASGRPSGGLAHMRTRAQLIGAEFDLRADGGTEVVIRVPQKPAEPARTAP